MYQGIRAFRHHGAYYSHYREPSVQRLLQPAAYLGTPNNAGLSNAIPLHEATNTLLSKARENFIVSELGEGIKHFNAGLASRAGVNFFSRSKRCEPCSVALTALCTCVRANGLNFEAKELPEDQPYRDHFNDTREPIMILIRYE